MGFKHSTLLSHYSILLLFKHTYKLKASRYAILEVSKRRPSAIISMIIFTNELNFLKASPSFITTFKR